MLGKLLKHEYLYIIKSFTPIYIAYFGVTLILKIILHIIYSSRSSVESSGFVTFAVIFIVIWYVFTLVLSLLTITNNSRRFKKSMFGYEGYLTNTLPVTSTNNIVAKLIAGATNYVASFIAIFISVNVLAAGLDELEIANSDFLENIGDAISNHFGEVFAYFVCSTTAYVAFMLFCYMMSAISSMIGGNKVKSFFIGLGLIFANIFMLSMIAEMIDATSAISVFYSYALYFTCVAAVEFLMINNIVKNKLNLQ